MPDIRQMARRAARRKEDHVDPHVIARFGKLMEEDFRRRSDAGEAALVDGEVKIGGGGAGLYLYKGEHRAAPCDKVHLPRWRAQAAADDAPALEAQPPSGNALRLTAALFGLLPLHPFNSMARA